MHGDPEYIRPPGLPQSAVGLSSNGKFKTAAGSSSHTSVGAFRECFSISTEIKSVPWSNSIRCLKYIN